MKFSIKHLVTSRKLHAALVVVVIFAALFVRFLPEIRQAFALYEVTTVDQDGGYSGTDYTDVPPSKIAREVRPPTIQPIDVSIQTLTGTTGSAAGYRQKSWQVTQTLWYAWNRGTLPSSDSSMNGWVAALNNPNITIGYDFGMFDADNPSQMIPEGSTIASGKHVILKFNPYVPDNIFWFGTGYSMDSPYGEWRADAAAPNRSGNLVLCQSKDLTAKYTLSGYGDAMNFDVYIPFVVNPPSRSLSNINGLSCGTLTTNADGSMSADCTANGTGDISPTFNYSDTYGRFYYRYYDYRDMTSIGWGGPGCYGNNIPMTSSFGSASGPDTNSVTDMQSAYTFPVPAQSFSYPVTIGPSSNQPPTAPTISCSSPVIIGNNVSVSLQAADPEGNKVQYAVDWIDDGVKEANSGWTDLVPSGTAQSLTKSGGYATAGTYTIYAWARDEFQSASTPPVSCTVTVTTNPVADLTATTGSAASIQVNQAVTLSGIAKNIGNATSGTFPNLIQVCDNGSTDNTTGCHVLNTNGALTATAGNALAPNATQSISASYTPTSTLQLMYRMCVNETSSWTNVATESDYGANNCGNWVSLAVTAIPPTCADTGQLGTYPACYYPVTANLSASPTSIPQGTSAQLSWSSTNATSCTSAQFATGSRASSGASPVSVSPLSTTTYTLTCSDAAGHTGTSNATVTVTSPLVLSITGTPQSVRKGDSATIQWSATGGFDSCSISGPGLSASGFSGSRSVVINAESTYTVSCVRSGVTSSKSTTVKILPFFIEQ